MKSLKKPAPAPQQFYYSDDELKPRNSFNKPSETRSSHSSSSNEIVFLGEFPQTNINSQAFSYKESTSNFEKPQNSSKSKPFSIKMSEGFTFIETFDLKQYQNQEIFLRLCPSERYNNNPKCNICAADFNFLVNRKKIW